jgi:integrase
VNCRIQLVLGKTGLMQFVEFEQGMIVRKGTEDHTPRIIRLDIGNPLIMKEMAKHVPDAGPYVSVTVKQVGWHSLRRAYATILYSNENDVKTAQELMRHSNPAMAMGVCAQAVTTNKRQAQERLAMTILQPATDAQLA